jgi:muramoyltetrapeptide carboxypeptidase
VVWFVRGVVLAHALVLSRAGAAAEGVAEVSKPPPLRKGDTIGLVAPASPVPAETVRAAAANLERRGFTVKVAPGSEARRGYLAGTDAARAEALNGFLRDPSVKAVLCLRGGFGSPRILDRVDYDAIRRDPKVIIGYSDITALLLAVQRRAGVVTFHGPMGGEWAPGRGITPYSEKYFWDAFADRSPLFTDWGGERAHGMKEPTALAGGSAEGILTGGNLSVLCSLLGTPYEIDTRDSILFLEDVSERPFRIDRMLNQLRLAGKLGQARGILLGAFTNCEDPNPSSSLSLGEVFTDYFATLGVPVLADYPAGHTADQATLPIGIRVRLDATARKLSFLETPVAGRAGAEEAVPPDDAR